MQKYWGIFCIVLYSSFINLHARFIMDQAEEDILKNAILVNATTIDRKLIHNKHSLECIPMPFQYLDTIYKTCVFLSDHFESDLITNHSFWHSINDEELFTNDVSASFVSGYVLGFESCSCVDGYLDDQTFYGRIIIGNQVFYMERADKFATFPKSNLTALSKFITKTDCSSICFQRKTKREAYKGKVCTVIALIDYSFFRIIGNLRRDIALGIVFSSLNRVNAIYRSTDWNNDGTADNIGLHILYFVILRNETSYVKTLQNKPMDPVNYLYRVSKFPKFRTACLGIAFTAQSFTEKTLGLSYVASHRDYFGLKFSVGGICDNKQHHLGNIAVITYKDPKGGLISQTVGDITLAHEIGHCFGADHDSKQCAGYLMANSLKQWSSVNNFKFSSCSKKQISTILKSRPNCLQSLAGDFCGNRIKELGEDCDCGSYYECILTDKCCIPFGKKNACQVNKEAGFDCHPHQGLCCTDHCVYRDISHLGLSCDHFMRFNCEILRDGDKCGLDGGLCSQGVCHSNECSRISLPECICKPSFTDTKCRTCCIYKGNCMPAINATEKLLKNNLTTLFYKLAENNVKYTKNDHYLTSCFDGECLKIWFKVYNYQDYCVIFGNLGICSMNYICGEVSQKIGHLPASGKSIFCPSFFYIQLISFIVLFQWNK